MLISVLTRCFLLLLGISLLNSCGFHLRGNTPVPKELQTLYLQSEKPFGSFEQVLRENLRTYKINVVDDSKQAPIALNIISAQPKLDTGAISSDSQMRQYTVSFAVQYQILSPSGQVIIATQSVNSSSTTFTVNINKTMLDSDSLIAQYLPNLQRDAVFRMMERLLANDSRAALTQYFQQSQHQG